MTIHELTNTTHPALFAAIGTGIDAPEQMWATGNLDVLTDPRPGVAVTGARAGTGYGEHVTTELVSDLAGDVRIITGGAYGIDAAAIRSALLSHSPVVLVAAGSVDRAYPAGHVDLFERVISSGGVILSENEPGTPPTRARFVRRCQLVAAIANVTVIPEAGYRSGSLTVATTAHQLGRPVGAVPGPITSASSAGGHWLIRQHIAQLVTTAAEIRELIAQTN